MILRCFRCGRTPEEIPEYSQALTGSALEPTAYVIAEEGTLNPDNGHFCCTDCYIAIGQPTGAGWRRWKAP